MYGYPAKVKEDSKTLNKILQRQGTDFILHVLAEHVGTQNLLWKFKDSEIENIINHMTKELKESILERV